MTTTQKQIDVKTIDINAKEWFDRSAGNSYFSANVTLNYGTDNAIDIYIPFQYGYDSTYIHEAAMELNKAGYITLKQYSNGSFEALWQYCRDRGIILRTNKQENCRKKDL